MRMYDGFRFGKSASEVFCSVLSALIMSKAQNFCVFDGRRVKDLILKLENLRIRDIDHTSEGGLEWVIYKSSNRRHSWIICWTNGRCGRDGGNRE